MNLYMEKFNKMKLRKKANLKIIRDLILFVSLIIFTFCFIFKDQNINELIITIKSTKVEYVLLGTFLMLLS